MPNFNTPDGELSGLFITDADILDRYVGNQLWLWGHNQFGGSGDNTTINRSSPVQTVAAGTNWKQVAGGVYHSAGIKTDGTLWAWGHNAYGQLGDNTTIQRNSPVQTVAAGTNWKQVSCTGNFTAAIKTNGTLWTWGRNQFGGLGDNTTINRSSPVQTVAAGTNWKQVACGGFHVAATKTDGRLWTWGLNAYGQLGDNTTIQRNSPVQTVAGGTNWKLNSIGVISTAALKTDGTLWTWGHNLLGTLGDNTRTNRSSPVQTVASGTNWKQIGGGAYFVAAIKTDGTLWIWGQNQYGNLGDNTVIHRSSPVQTVAGGTNWKQVGGSQFIGAAIKTDGTLWTWGRNVFGGLGDNTTINRSSPVQTVAGGTNWKLSNSGGYYSLGAVTYTES